MNEKIKMNIGYVATPALIALDFYTQHWLWMSIYSALCILAIALASIGLAMAWKESDKVLIEAMRRNPSRLVQVTPLKVAIGFVYFVLVAAYLIYAGHLWVLGFHTLSFVLSAVTLFRRRAVLLRTA